MAVTLDPAIAFAQLGTVLELGVGPTNIDALNLGLLGTQISGQPVPLTDRTETFSIMQPDGSDGALNVGEKFTIVRTVLDSEGSVVGTPTEVQYTLQGSGELTPLLGATRDIIVATDSEGAQIILFPDNDPPVVTGTVAVSVDADPVGYDLVADAPLCFARGALLETPQGRRAVEDLKIGDLVTTKDHGDQPIRWIGSSRLTPGRLARNPHLKPIRIRAGALGQDAPTQDLLVSPQHRILVRSRIAMRMFDAPEVLVAAKQLLQLDGIDICDDPAEGVTYFHVLFDQHEIVFANGAEAESLFTGPEAIRTVGPAALEEIYEILPQLRDRDYAPQGARVLTSGRMGRKLVSRHIQHRKFLV